MIDEIEHKDLRYPYKPQDKFDLAISIEVAEHIDKEYADIYIDSMCHASDTILMTAAPKGQGGIGHVNEQSKEWWIKRFEKRGYKYDSETVKKLEDAIQLKIDLGFYSPMWLKPNLLVFKYELQTMGSTITNGY